MRRANALFCCRRNDYWRPGETLPLTTRCSGDPVQAGSGSHDQSQSQSLADMLQVFQSSMDKQLSSVCEKLETIDSRMVVLEVRQKNLEEEIRSSASCSSSTNTTLGPSRQRKRLTPLALQV